MKKKILALMLVLCLCVSVMAIGAFAAEEDGTDEEVTGEVEETEGAEDETEDAGEAEGEVEDEDETEDAGEAEGEAEDEDEAEDADEAEGEDEDEAEDADEAEGEDEDEAEDADEAEDEDEDEAEDADEAEDEDEAEDADEAEDEDEVASDIPEAAVEAAGGDVHFSATVSASTVAVGDIVTVTVSLDTNPGVAAFSVELWASDNLELISSEQIFSEGMVAFSGSRMDFVQMGNTTYTGALFTLTYQATAEGPASFVFTDVMANNDDMVTYVSSAGVTVEVVADNDDAGEVVIPGGDTGNGGAGSASGEASGEAGSASGEADDTSTGTGTGTTDSSASGEATTTGATGATSPQTGDSSNMGIYVALFVLCGMGVVAVVVYRKVTA